MLVIFDIFEESMIQSGATRTILNLLARILVQVLTCWRLMGRGTRRYEFCHWFVPVKPFTDTITLPGTPMCCKLIDRLTAKLKDEIILLLRSMFNFVEILYCKNIVNNVIIYLVSKIHRSIFSFFLSFFLFSIRVKIYRDNISTCMFSVYVQLFYVELVPRKPHENEIVEDTTWFCVKCRQFQQIMKIHRDSLPRNELRDNLIVFPRINSH